MSIGTYTTRPLLSLLLLGSMCLLDTAWAEAPTTTEPAPPTAFSSFIDFYPKAPQYQAELAPFFEAAGNTLQPKSMASQTGNFAPPTLSGDEKEKLASAIAKAEDLREKLPRGLHDELFFLGGFAEERRGDLAAALSSYEKSLDLKSANPLVRFRHALALLALKKYQPALTEFKEVRWQTPQQDHELLYLEGECAAAMGQVDPALRAYEGSHQRNPNFLPTLRRLIPLYEAQLLAAPTTKLRAAIKPKITELLNVLVDRDPKDTENSLKFAHMLIEQSDPSAREAQLKHGFTISERVAVASKYKDIQAVKLLAQSQRMLGDLDGAAQSIQLAINANPKVVELQQIKEQIKSQKALVATAESTPTAPPTP